MDSKLIYHEDIEKWQEINEDWLMDYWEEFKYGNLCGEYFHYDDVDYWNEDFFDDMCSELYFNFYEKTGACSEWKPSLKVIS